jgi:protein-S-isoprenylcysteine O-methyltransferase Ste14
MELAMHGIISIIFFIVVLLSIIISAARHKLPEAVGKPPINRWLFLTGKLLLGVSCGFYFVQAWGVDLHSLAIPEHVLWIAVGLLTVGTTLISLSIFHLGESTRVGLPTTRTNLKTEGLFRMSRNPIYLGAYFIGVASCLYCPNVFNILASVGFIVIHHRIILGEEAFLRKQFGDEWRAYAKRVKRYL